VYEYQGRPSCTQTSAKVCYKVEVVAHDPQGASKDMSVVIEDLQHMVSKTDPLWSYTRLTLFPFNTLLLPHDMVNTIERIQEGICHWFYDGGEEL